MRYLLAALNVACCETAKRPELGEWDGAHSTASMCQRVVALSEPL